jgi:hypothetical protein
MHSAAGTFRHSKKHQPVHDDVVKIALRNVLHSVRRTLHRHSFLFPIGLGILVIALAYTHYQSPLHRLRLYGCRLALRPPQDKPTSYLIGMESRVDIWTERRDSPDAALDGVNLMEMGRMTLTPVHGTETEQVARARVTEWVRTLDLKGQPRTDQIPANHPSIAPGTVLLDRQGTVLEYPSPDRTRVGRVLQSLFPRFPKGVQRSGSAWSEDFEWIENLGQWRLHFQGNAHWKILGYEDIEHKSCVRLVYDLRVIPAVIQKPAWAKAGPDSPVPAQEPLSGSGEAIYDPVQKALLMNSFTYSGIVSVAADKLEEIPWEERPSNMALQGPGLIRLRLSDRWDIRQP